MSEENFIISKMKNGFTLAEVLITLVIIGIVAALTIPTVVNTYVETSTVGKVKKTLSILGQAKKLAEAQNGSVEGWNFDEGASSETAAQFWNYLKPHISVSKDCGTESACYPNSSIYTLVGTISGVDYHNSIYYHIVLADGSVIWFRTGGDDKGGKCSHSAGGGIENMCARFWYDVNGDKKPNTAGIDLFVYDMNIDGVYPHHQDDCYKDSSGWGCTEYIIKKGNMKYLH